MDLVWARPIGARDGNAPDAPVGNNKPDLAITAPTGKSRTNGPRLRDGPLSAAADRMRSRRRAIPPRFRPFAASTYPLAGPLA